MATKQYPYYCEDGETIIACSCDEDLMSLSATLVYAFNVGTGVAAPIANPTGYVDLAALQAVHATAVERPNSVQVRGINLSVPSFGGGFLPILDNRSTAGTFVGGRQFEATIRHWGLSDTELPSPTTVQLDGGPFLGISAYSGEAKNG